MKKLTVFLSIVTFVLMCYNISTAVNGGGSATGSDCKEGCEASFSIIAEDDECYCMHNGIESECCDCPQCTDED